MRFASLALPALALFTLSVTLLLAKTRVDAGGVVDNCASDTQFSAKLTGGGNVSFTCGTATIMLSSEETITADTTIDGGGVITLDGGSAHRLFSVNGGVTLTLKNIVLTNGFANGDGGAIYSEGHLVLDHVTVQNSQTDPASSGGAIVTYGPLDITDSILAGNSAGNGGAIFPRFPAAHVTITDSTLHDNHATNLTDGWGGAILLWDGAAVNIVGSDLYSNTARFGGAIYNSFANSSMSLERTTLRDNSAQSHGGAIYNKNGPAELTDSSVSGNYAAGDGGGVYNFQGSMALDGVTLDGNYADTGGGAIWNWNASIGLINSTVSGNTSTWTPGIHNDGTAF